MFYLPRLTTEDLISKRVSCAAMEIEERKRRRVSSKRKLKQRQCRESTWNRSAVFRAASNSLASVIENTYIGLLGADLMKDSVECGLGFFQGWASLRVQV
jgi:hypothetical protein